MKVKYPDDDNLAAKSESKRSGIRDMNPGPPRTPTRTSEHSSSQQSTTTEPVRRVLSNSSEEPQVLSPTRHTHCKSHSSVSSVGTRLVGMLADRVVADFIEPDSQDFGSGKDHPLKSSQSSSIQRADILCNTSIFGSQDNTQVKNSSASTLSLEQHCSTSNRSQKAGQDKDTGDWADGEGQESEELTIGSQLPDSVHSSGALLKTDKKRVTSVNRIQSQDELPASDKDHVDNNDGESEGTLILQQQQQKQQDCKSAAKLDPQSESWRDDVSVSSYDYCNGDGDDVDDHVDHVVVAINTKLKQVQTNSKLRNVNWRTDDVKNEQFMNTSPSETRLGPQRLNPASERDRLSRSSNSESTIVAPGRGYQDTSNTESLTRSLDRSVDSNRNQYVVRRVFHASSLADGETESSDSSVLSLEVSSVVGQDTMESGDFSNHQVLGRLRKAKPTSSENKSSSSFERSKELTEKRKKESITHSQSEILSKTAPSPNRKNEKFKEQTTPSQESSSLTPEEKDQHSRPHRRTTTTTSSRKNKI